MILIKIGFLINKKDVIITQDGHNNIKNILLVSHC